MTVEIDPQDQDKVRRFVALLKQAIRAAGFSVSEVERRLGVGPKALRRIFSGHVDLKLKHAYAILRIIGMSEQEFFALVGPQAPGSQSSAAGILAVFPQVGFPGNYDRRVHEPKAPSGEDFDRWVEEAVNRILGRRGLTDSPEPKSELESKPKDEPKPEPSSEIQQPDGWQATKPPQQRRRRPGRRRTSI